MENAGDDNNEIVKKESVGYLKSKVNLQQGELFLTSDRISLRSRKAGPMTTVNQQINANNKSEKEATVFDLDIDKIQSVHNGEREMKNDVLEITDEHNVTHRILVKNSQEWLDAINLH